MARLVSMDELARSLGVPVDRVRHLVRSGAVEAFSFGGRYVFSEDQAEDVKRAIEQHEATKSEDRPQGLMTPPGWLGLDQVSRECGISRWRLTVWCRNGEIPAEKFGGAWILREADIEELKAFHRRYKQRIRDEAKDELNGIEQLRPNLYLVRVRVPAEKTPGKAAIEKLPLRLRKGVPCLIDQKKISKSEWLVKLFYQQTA